MPRKYDKPGRNGLQMCKETENGQPEGCPNVSAPAAAEILRILRSLDADQRREALRLLPEPEKNAKGGGGDAAPEPR